MCICCSLTLWQGQSHVGVRGGTGSMGALSVGICPICFGLWYGGKGCTCELTRSAFGMLCGIVFRLLTFKVDLQADSHQKSLIFSPLQIFQYDRWQLAYRSPFNPHDRAVSWKLWLVGGGLGCSFVPREGKGVTRAHPRPCARRKRWSPPFPGFLMPPAWLCGCGQASCVEGHLQVCTKGVFFYCFSLLDSSLPILYILQSFFFLFP